MKKYKLVNIVNKVIELAKSDTFKEDYRMSKKDFTRNRKLSFFDNIMLIMQCSKCSIQSGINMYLHSRNEYGIFKTGIFKRETPYKTGGVQSPHGNGSSRIL